MKMIHRNRELKRELIWSAAVTVVFAVGGFFISPVCGALILGLGIVLILLELRFTLRRYDAIAELARDIDGILHGQSAVLITDSDEGELSILNSEIHKMTIRLNEQAGMLRDDKLRLTDAIADIFHQMRTPLTAMNLTTSLLTEEELSFERRIQLTRELKKQLERTQWLVETLLKISRLDAGTVEFKQETVRLDELIARAAAPFEIAMELRGQTFTAETGDESFIGDMQWTTEAVSNLIKNCMEHTPESGTIRVKTAENSLYTEITVRDSGAGFSAEDLPHIFERFYKGKTSGDANIGIGLALSRMIIAGQNGVLSAKNHEDGGAEFTIRFYKSIV